MQTKLYYFFFLDFESLTSPSGLAFCQFKGFCLYIGHGGTVNCKFKAFHVIFEF